VATDEQRAAVAGRESPLLDAAMQLVERVAGHGWRGPDPYDGLWWPWPRPLVAGPRRRQVITQLHARCPFDVRRVYRRRHPCIAKALALFGRAALRAHSLTQQPRSLALALEALQIAAADRSAHYRSWGYPFDVQTRWSFYPAGTPNVVVTAFTAMALLEAGDELARSDFIARGRAAAIWTLEEVWSDSGGFFAYHPGTIVNVHNANLLAAALVWTALGDDSLARDRVARAVDRTLSAQSPDGWWPYGESRTLGWVDSFHTGFLLGSLVRLRGLDGAVDGALARGARHYHRFFDASGRALLWGDRRFPEDAHSAGTGLSTLSALARNGYAERSLVERVARRVMSVGIRHGQAVHRRYRWGRTTVWYPRWCDGHVALGLVDAAALAAGVPQGRHEPTPRGS
jgi:hypothetical protein